MMILDYTRGVMIEQLVHFYAGEVPDPVALRRHLESLTYEELAKEYQKLQELS